MDTEKLKKLNEAVYNASKRLAVQNPPAPIVEIENEQNISIVICQKYDEDEVPYLLIRCNNNTRIKLPVDKYLHILLTGLKECRIFINTKLVRVMFKDCSKCQISLRSPIISAIEFFRCKECNLNMRLNCSEYSSSPIPLISLEECNMFHIFQGIDEITYIIKLCERITGTIIDANNGLRLSSYELGKLFWDSIEQNLIYLSKDNGFISTSMNYELNNIGQIFTKNPLENIEDDDSQDINNLFGTTPPI